MNKEHKGSLLKVSIAAVLNDNSLNLVWCSAELLSCVTRHLLLGWYWLNTGGFRRFEPILEPPCITFCVAKLLTGREELSMG
jgi:hypothetical protein